SPARQPRHTGRPRPTASPGRDEPATALDGHDVGSVETPHGHPHVAGTGRRMKHDESGAVVAPVLAGPPGCLEAGAVRVPARDGEPAGGGAHVAAAQLRDERVAGALDRVFATVDLELAPDAGHPAGSQVAHLVGIAAA